MESQNNIKQQSVAIGATTPATIAIYIPNEVLAAIFRNIDTGSGFKSARLVSKRWQKVVDSVHPRGRVEFCNGIKTLFWSLVGQSWNIQELMRNRQVKDDCKFINFISMHLCLTKKALINERIRGSISVKGAQRLRELDTLYQPLPKCQKSAPVDWNIIKLYVNIKQTNHTIDEIKAIVGELFKGGRVATWNEIRAEERIAWNYEYLIRHLPLCRDILIDPIARQYSYEASINESMTIQIIRDNLDFPWEWEWLADNKNLSLDDILDNEDLPWVYTGIDVEFMYQAGVLYPGCSIGGYTDVASESGFDEWLRAYDLSLEPLTWEEVLQDPDEYNFRYISANERI